MSQTSLHSCSGCDNSAENTDCATCKLAFLNEAKKKATQEPDDDYSISERLTEKKGDNSILYLFIAGVAVFGCVLLFTWLMR